MFCRYCGKEVGEIDAFCPYCGAKLNNNATTAPAQSATPPMPAPMPAPVAPAPMPAPAPAKMSVLAPVGFSLPFLAVVLLAVSFTFVDESFSTYSLFVFLGAISAVVGLVLSIVGVVRNNKLGGNRTGKGLAIAGIVLNAGAGLFALEMIVVWLILWIALAV